MCFLFIKYKLATGTLKDQFGRIIQLEAIDFKTWVIPAPEQREMLDGSQAPTGYYRVGSRVF